MTSSRPMLAIFMLIALQTSSSSATEAAPPPCKTFAEIYPSGKELCEKMWDGAFKYEKDEPKAYTMWFFGSTNPNDAVAKSLGALSTPDHEQCHLNYYHKDTPGPEPDAFTECHPWKENACCAHETVMSATKLNEGYGEEYHWDRCGPLSPECERFFVQEACFYECDPNAGLYRKYQPDVFDKNNPEHNEWQMSNMPIKASYCDAWFTACRNDKFCASDGGSFFSCAAEYKKVDEVAKLQAELTLAQEQAAAAAAQAGQAVQTVQVGQADDDGIGTGPIVGFIVAGVLILALTSGSCFLVMRERAGKPLFGRLLDGPASGGQAVGNSQF